MIVKIQRNLSGPSSILIYDKPIEPVTNDGITDTHKVFLHIPMPEQKIVAILGEDAKGYFEAESGEGSIIVGKRVPDQDW